MSRLSQSIIVVLFLLASLAAEAQSSSGIKREQRRNRQQIEQARRNVRQNEQAVENNLRQLELLDGEITDISRDVRRLRGTSDSLRQLIRPLNDSINDLNSRLSAMSEKYKTALRKSQTNGNSLNDITFVFSSENFMQAWQRYRSLRQFARWRQRKADEIIDVRSSLQSRLQRLDSLKASNNRVLSNVEQQRNTLERKRVETDRLVTSLKSQNKQLQQVLKRRQKEADELDRRLEKALAEEMEKQRREEEERQRRLKEQEAAASKQASETATKPAASDKQVQPKPAVEAPVNSQLTGSFESNKGKLPYPLSGQFTIVKKFGRQKHPRLPKVETNNPGIDIEASTQGATVHAVFDGEVSQIFKLAGYNNVIVLRHGDYVTVYANIARLDVKKGDKVKTGQALGSLYVDKADGNRSVLHFELRREKEKENPELWLKR
ncbi:MAG: peptidoglycan DD-metalloendopeptidase family protein [Muribaculaceae bacterium]|nr:peptidoglycan DD-metalloendopeptidase family protein [Muribaculaceae bacterium]